MKLKAVQTMLAMQYHLAPKEVKVSCHNPKPAIKVFNIQIRNTKFDIVIDTIYMPTRGQIK